MSQYTYVHAIIYWDFLAALKALKPKNSRIDNFAGRCKKMPKQLRASWLGFGKGVYMILLMDNILHDLKDSKLWELWYIPYNG